MQVYVRKRVERMKKEKERKRGKVWRKGIIEEDREGQTDGEGKRAYT